MSDCELAELESKEKELFSKFFSLPNGEERDSVFLKWRKVYDELTRLYTIPTS